MRSSWRFVAAAAGALALAGCGRAGGGADADRAPEAQVEVRVAPLAEHEFRDWVAAPGAWKSAGEVTLRAPSAGTLESLGPRVGEMVTAGSVVGSVETRDSRAALEGATALAREATTDRARADAARALALAKGELVRVRLTAPITGVVLARAVEPGALVDDASVILTLAPRGGRVFEAHVPVGQLARVRRGQHAEIGGTGGASAGAGAPRAATVRDILPTIDATDQAGLVWLAPAPGADPPLGQYETARIEVGRARRALAVPDSAVVEDDVTGERRVALVGADGRAAWTVVTLGADDAGWAELLAPPLPAASRVVVVGQRGLPDHARVTIAR